MGGKAGQAPPAARPRTVLEVDRRDARRRAHVNRDGTLEVGLAHRVDVDAAQELAHLPRLAVKPVVHDCHMATRRKRGKRENGGQFA